MFDLWKVRILLGCMIRNMYFGKQNLRRIGPKKVGSSKEWSDISSITSAAPLMLIVKNQIMTI